MNHPNKPWYICKKKWETEQGHLAGKISETGKGNSVIHDYLYSRLSIIDGKVGSLLSVNAILLAVAGILVFKLPECVDIYSVHLLKASVFLWLISTFICLWVSFLKWEYLDSTASNNDGYLDKIISVTVARTRYYNTAVTSILISIVLFSYVSYKYFWV